MKDSRALSSVQALDDYFDALLDEDFPVEQNVGSTSHKVEDSVELKPQPIVLEPSDTFSGATLTKDERDLSSVEKLLSQLKLEEEMEVDVELEQDLVNDVETTTQTIADVAIEPDTALDVEVAVETVTETMIDTEVDSAVETEVDAQVEIQDVVVEEVTAEVESEVDSEVQHETETESETEVPWRNIIPDSAFQVLFFESVGVTYAVPLAELGGIHRLEACNHLIGRPDWYLGLQTERDQQLDVVDTAKWVMPEKIADNSHRDDYSYIVILGDSKWGLACNALLGTESLRGEQVRWREQAGKRPWLAGLVKERMCALIHVEALIAMLNQGIDANALA